MVVHDVFLSYRRSDGEIVRRIADRLRDDAGLTLWIDVWSQRGGDAWSREIPLAIRNSRAIAVFVGADGVDGWVAKEIDLALGESVRREARVFPVLLPGL